jgi:hypothetical protein
MSFKHCNLKPFGVLCTISLTLRLAQDKENGCEILS